MAKKAKKKTARKKVSKKKAVKKNIKKTAKKKSPKKTAAKKKKTTRKPKTPKTSMSDILGALNQLNTKVEKLLVLVEKPKTVSSAEEIKPGLLILTGGNSLHDLEPGDPLAAKRDKQETALLEEALRRDVAVIGVCRGMQLIAHFFGSRLEKVSGHAGTRHSIKLIEGRLFSELYRNDFEVNSYHDYGVMQAGKELETGAICPGDGVIEALQHKNLPVYGIMWHPERESIFSDKDIHLFQRLSTQSREKL